MKFDKTFRGLKTRKSYLGAIMCLSLTLSTFSGFDLAHATKTSGTKKPSVASATKMPTVTSPAGVAPVISKPSGTPPGTLLYKDIVVGKGATAGTQSTISSQYVLMLWKSGSIISNTWSSTGPQTFSLNQVIAGWRKGIAGMKIGGRRLLVIPPALGYGATGKGPIGPDETLVFVVDLLGVS